jgi:hypothetical protein
MIGPLLEPVFALLFRLLFWIFAYFVALPLLWVISTPVILIVALFGNGTYAKNVASGYAGVRGFWLWIGPGTPN